MVSGSAREADRKTQYHVQLNTFSGFGLVGRNSLVGSITAGGQEPGSWGPFVLPLALCYSRGLCFCGPCRARGSKQCCSLQSALSGCCNLWLCEAPSDNHSSERRNWCWFVLRVALVGLGFINQSSMLDSIKGVFVIRRHPHFSA